MGTAFKSRRRTRVLLIVCLIVGAGGTLAANGCSTWIAHAIVDAPNKGIASFPSTLPAELTRLGIARAERVSVGPPAATLDVWIIDPSGPPRGTILVLHGVRDRKRTQIGLGKKLAADGYRAALVDLRGHGESTGDWITYGVVESRDLMQVLDALQSRDLINEPIGIVGASFGGACAMQLASIDDRVKAVVAIATFTSLRDVVPSYLDRTGFGWAVSNAKLNQAFMLAGELASFDPVQASPMMAISRCRTPILFIHGAADSHIPPDHSRCLHAAASSGQSKLVIIEDANHDTIMADHDGTIWRETQAWFAAHLK